jgi:hypothetical protein
MSASHQPLWTRRTIAIGVLAALAGVIAWHLLGRPWWCESGPGIWSAAWRRCTSQHLFDPYTLSHVLHGIMFFWMLQPLAQKITMPWRTLTALLLEIAWELLENSPIVIERYRQQTAALGYTGDSILNILGDIIASVVGIAFAARFSWKAAAFVFVAFELLMLLMARDNLTLNVLMLLFPMEGIEQWQLGQ